MEQTSPQSYYEQKKDYERVQILPQEMLNQIHPLGQREEWSEERWREIANMLKPYLERNPYNGDYWIYYGFANEKLGCDEEALDAYRKTITYGSNYEAEAAYRLGHTLARLGRGDEALKWLEASLLEALILDLRLNGGGDLTTYRPLLHSIIRSKKINRRGHFFALIGRRTFSAAQHFSGQLELHTAVTFVGEPTGSRPGVVGEDNAFRLPFSGMAVNVSNLYWQSTYAFDHRQWLPPHLSVEMASNDYQNNQDPALEAILEGF